MDDALFRPEPFGLTLGTCMTHRSVHRGQHRPPDDPPRRQAERAGRRDGGKPDPSLRQDRGVRGPRGDPDRRGDARLFRAGGDIAAWSGWSPEAFGTHWVRDGHAAFDALARLRQPLIAVLNGHALGGGLELAACADLRIAEAHVKLGQPETGLGIIPGWSGTQRAVRRFGAQTVRRMALFGEVFSAEQALALGLVDQVAAIWRGACRRRCRCRPCRLRAARRPRR